MEGETESEVSVLCQNFVLEPVSCAQIDTQLYNCKQSWPLSRDDNLASAPDRNVDSVNSCIFQDVNVSTADIEEKMPAWEDGACKEGNEAPQSQLGGPSLAENVETPTSSSSLSTQPGEHNHQNNHDATHTLDQVASDHHVVDDENRLLSDGRMAALRIHTQYTNESPCNLVTQVQNLDADSTVDVPTSSPVPQISDAADSTCRQSMENEQERDGFSADPSCSNVADSSRLPGVEKEGNGQHDLALPSNLSDFSLQPRRSTRCNKYSKAEKKKTPALRLRAKPVNKKLLPGKCFLNAVRRKRSCLYNRARASIWGSLANISQVKVDDGARKDGNHLIQSENQRSHKRRGGSGDGRRQKTNAGSSFPTKELSGVSTDHSAHTRLKVKFGGQSGNRSLNVIESEMLYPSLMLPTPGGKCATRPGNPTSTEISDCENYNSGRYTYANGDCEDVLPFPCARFQDSLSVDKDLESTITQDTSDLHRLGNCSLGYSQIRTEGTEEAVGKQYSDPGTSPDSEVINLIQDVSAGTNAGFVSTQAIDPTDAAASTMELLSLRKQKISCKVESTAFSLAGSLALEGKLLECNKKMSPVENRREEEVRGHNPSDTSSLGSNENGSQSYSNAEGHFNQSAEHENVGDVPRVETIDRSSEFLGPNIGVISSELLGPNVLLGSGETRGLKPSSKSSAKERKKSVSASNRRKNAHGKRKEEDQKSINKRKIKERDSPSQVQENHRQTSGSINISLGTTELSESGEPSECFKVETTGVAIRNDLGISIASNIAPKDLSNSSVLSSGYDEQLLPSPDAWVRCDECHKWRCISTELADSIEATNCRWICSENMDKAFADCSIPQEKSNAEINRELELAEFSGEEDASCAHPVAKGFPDKDLTVSQQAPWKPIVSNLFLHRTRKTQTIDEIMICHCKPPLDGGLGCGDECLNRMLNIECVRGTCPCGDRCSNQQFQKRKYAKMESVRCGKKGYGLQLLDNVSEGDFLIEYVGEVLDLNAYEARQREYASRGQRHFYFMTLNGSEVIDACAKGNLGRFINHSCDPNCRTEKWMVNGEVCIGLFAIRNIKKGEELTFDYNYVRVFGAAAKRCVCGSSDCRGYIGGDPLNNGAVVQGDSDEEFPEPVMVDDGFEIGKGRGEVASNTILSDDELPKRTDPISASFIPPLENSINKEDDAVGRGHTVQPIEILPGKEERINEDTITRSLCAVQPIETLLIKEETVKEETITRSLSPIQPPEISISDTKNESSVIQPLGDSLLKDNTVGKVLPAIQYPDALSTVTVTTKRFISDTAEERHKSSKARSTGKLPRSSCSIKKANSISKPVSASKSQVLASKPKKVMEVFASSHPKGAEDMLNSLLDTDGGISKQKDATRGYLMLLFVTASSGDNVNGEAVQSTRDLSITLDALLKTRKRNVLKDIVNKNGLQMLHNIMKQNRKNFSRIPIIRKLLKILDHLAERGVLTLEHINSAPPRAGMESFRESIFQLTRHSDVKVHQIARDFRDKWIPRSFRSNTYSDGNQINSEPQVGLHSNRFSPYRRWGNNSPRPMEDSESISQRALQAIPSYANAPEDSSGPRVNYYSANSRSCKRKSRWDQPEPNSGQQSLEFAHGRKEKRKFVPCPQLPETREVIMGQVDEVNHETVCYGYSISKQCEDSASVEQHMDGDSPPGFPSAPPVQGDGFSTVVSNLPSDIHHRMCSCEVVTGTLQEVYDSESPVAYGVPVLFVDQLGTPVADSTDSWEISPGIPFHPFPPLPPYSRKETNGLAPLKNMENRDSQRDGPRDLYNQADPGVACTSGERTAEVCNHGAQNRPIVEQMRHTPGNLGRRYFRQEKWNNPRHHHPHWIGNRNAWRFKEKNPRSNACRLGVGSVENHVGHTEDEGGSGGIDQNSIPPSAYQNL